MRVLLVNPFGFRIGGIEIYLRHLAPELAARGYEPALVFEDPIPAGAEPVATGAMRTWCLAETGESTVLTAVRDWRPDIVYAHERVRPSALAALADAAPSLWFAHAYAGACISGARCWKFPRPRPCSRTFDGFCLLHYLPHRCGGWNPFTMFRLFRQERRTRQLLRRFDLLLTHSEPTRREYVRQGFPEERTRTIPFFVPGRDGTRARAPGSIDTGPLNLLFLGRFDPLKGGPLLIAAVAEVSRSLARPIELTMAGDGPERHRWQTLAARVESEIAGVRIRFPGWLGGEARVRALAGADLIVVPSVWPEPFGMTGIEAARLGVPAVAFDVGGIRAWLEPGLGGEVAPGDPPTAPGLAEAILRAVRDPEHYRHLCEGAGKQGGRFTADRHLEALERSFALATEIRARSRSRHSGGPPAE